MREDKKKKLLVLGGTYASLDVVKVAKQENIYTIVTDNLDGGVAKEIADEVADISTADIDGLVRLVKERQIDGVFCGPSEFNIANAIRVAEKANLPFYCNMDQWKKCSDKEEFKKMCREYDVPCVPGYDISKGSWQEDIKKVSYPCVVKPVDSCSSRGLSVCKNAEELEQAYDYALQFSKKKKVIVEKYIDNHTAMAARYLIYKGKAKLLFVNDQYTIGSADSNNQISGLSVSPSLSSEEYILKYNEKVEEMISGIGLEYGVAFLQALVENGQPYFHEMGLRLSGGLIYKITEPATGISDLKMMVRYMVGNEFSSDEEMKKVDPYLNNTYYVSVCIPLSPGTIGEIRGIDEIRNHPKVTSLLQYYKEGDYISQKVVGTLDQHFCRVKFFVDDYSEIIPMAEYVQNTIQIMDVSGHDMVYEKFDMSRLREK